MTSPAINIDFKSFAVSFSDYVVEKANQAGSAIVYYYNGKLVEENPSNGEIKILEEPYKLH